MVAGRRSRIRFRHARYGAISALIPFAALVIIPAAVVAGLAVAVPPGGTSAQGTGGGGGISVAIRWSVCLGFYAVVPGIPCATQPDTLSFTAVLTGGAPPYMFLWNFGDGSGPALGQIVHHTFPACSSYTVGVVVLSQSGGASNSTTVASCPIFD